MNKSSPATVRFVSSRLVKTRLATALIVAASLAMPSLQASTGTWNVDADGLWSNAGNWTPGIADGATFTANLNFGITANRIVTLDSARSIGILNIGDTNTTHGYTLATGVNTLTFDNGASDAQLNQSSTSNGDTISGLLALGGNGNLTITNAASAKTLTISAGITSALTSGTQTLTFNNDNAVSVSGVIGNGGSGGTIAVTKTGTGTTTLSGANSFTGGLIIKSGTVLGATSANGFGANTSVITLGDSTGGTANATLSGGAFTYLNPITVASTNTGTATITTSGVGTIFSGAITLNTHNLTALGASTNLTLSGGITGTGNLLINAGNGGIVTIGGTVNHVGTITNIGAGSPSNGNSISGAIGSNVTSIIQDSATAALTLSGNNSSYTKGITIKKGSLNGGAANSLGASTNVITLGDSAGSSSTTLAGSNAAGTILNPIQIASGNNGTAQISSTFSNGAIFNGLITLNSHDLTVSSSSGAINLGGGFASTGTGGNITLNSASANVITVSGATGINNVGTITNSGTGTATDVISAIIGSNVTGVIQNSATSKLTISGAQTYTATTTVNAGTLTGTQNSGTPFGTGNVVLNGGTLQLTPGTAAAAAVTGANAVAGSTFTYAGGATLGLTKNGANNLSYIVGNASPSGSVLVRSNNGTLVIAPTAAANLGSSEKFVVNGLTSAANINGIYDASVVDQVGTGNTGIGSFVKYDTTATNGFLDAATGTSSYTTRASDATLAANEISDVTASLTAADLSNPYALRVGAVTLTNAGTTTVNGGVFGSGTNSGLGGIILNPTATASVISGGTLAFGSSEGVVYVGSGAGGGSITSAITGTAGLTKFGPGVLTLNNAANTYTGTTTINSGTLAEGANDQIFSGAVTVNGPTAIFALGTFTDTVGIVTVANFGSITGTGTGALTSTGTFEMQSGSVSAILAGSGIALNKTTSGTVTLSGANTYTGATTVNAGTLQLSGASGATTGATAYTLNGGSLFLDNSANNNTNRINNSSTIALNGGSLLFKGLNNTTGSETIGAISGTGNSTITLTYTGNNTTANVVTLTAASFTHSAGNGTDLVNGLNLGQNSTGTVNIGRIILTTAPTLVGTTAALTSGINSAAKNTRIVPFLVGDAAPASNGAGSVSGTANTFLTYVAGSGLRPLNPTDEFTNNAITSGNNTYITSTTAAAATTAINSLVINGADLSIDDGATLTNSSGALLFVTSNTIKPTGTTGIYTGGLENQITVNSGVTGTINANINGSQPLTKSGVGSLVLGGANTYTGATAVSAGTLKAGVASVANTSGAFGNNSAVTLGNVAGVALDITGFNTQVGSLTGGGTAGGNVTLGAATLTTGGNNTSPAAYAGVISGTGGLTKIGTGTQTLTGVSTYSGNTTISAGTLALGSSGSIANSAIVNLGTSGSQGTFDLTAKSSFAFGTGQTLSGYGTVNIGSGKTVTINGNLAVGNSPGIITVTGDTTLASTATTTMELAGNGGVAGTDFDKLAVSGALTFGGTLNIVSFGGYNLAQAGTYDLFGLGSQSGNFSLVSVSGTALTNNTTDWSATNLNGSGFDYTFNLSTGDLVVIASAVPEPSTYALLGGALALAFAAWRSRKRA